MEDGVQRSLGQIEGTLKALQESVSTSREDNSRAFDEINHRLDTQNGRIREGEEWRTQAKGVWLGISAAVLLGGGAAVAAIFERIGG